MFFNSARGLAERGHQVQVFCDATEEFESAPSLGGAAVFKLESQPRIDPGTEVAIALNEPDLLRHVPKTAFRVLHEQLNDLSFTAPGFDEFVDLYAFPSETHRRFMAESCKLDVVKTAVLPNCLNIEFFEGEEQRRHHSVAYVSSPDRGLHWLLDFWPLVRKRVPDAELRIYYRIDPWIAGSRDLWGPPGNDIMEIGLRARFIEESLRRLGRNGENGVFVVGPTPNKALARELMKTEVMAYPCDPLRWTEGFSVATLDACAAGCVPLITDADAIGDIYAGVAEILPGRPQSRDPKWIDAIVHALTDDDYKATVRARLPAFAKAHDRKECAAQWEEMLTALLAKRNMEAA